MGLELTIERSYQTHSHNIHFKMTVLFRRFLKRRNMSSSRIHYYYKIIQFSSVFEFSSVAQSCPTPCDPMDTITSHRSPLKLLSIESVMPSHKPLLCRPLFLLPSILSSIRVLSNGSVFAL